MVRVGRGLSRPEYRQVRSSCEHGSDHSGSAIDGKFLDLLLAGANLGLGRLGSCLGR